MNHNNETADVFSEINSTRDQERVEKQYTEEYFQVRKGYFEGKDCLDIGCGAQPVGAKRLFQMGAESVTCVDIDESIETVGQEYLSEFSDRTTFVVEDANNFANDCERKFDHIHAAGSIHHMENKEIAFETIKSLSELSKGSLYVSLSGSGGLMREINSTLRKKYNNDSEFEQYIDELETDDLVGLLEYIGDNIEGDYATQMFLYYMKNEIDDDIVLSLKDRVTAPSYLRFSENELREFLKEECGMENIKRLEYYPELNNIRRIFAPLYENYDNKYARLLYGDGFIQLWCDI